MEQTLSPELELIAQQFYATLFGGPPNPLRVDKNFLSPEANINLIRKTLREAFNLGIVHSINRLNVIINNANNNIDFK